MPYCFNGVDRLPSTPRKLLPGCGRLLLIMVRDRLPSFGFNRFVPSSSVPSSSSEGIADHAAETAYQLVRGERGQHVYERLASFELVDQSKRDAACGSGCVGASHLLLLVRLMIAGMTRRKGMAGGNQKRNPFTDE